jgi:hypothetical protein
VHQWLTTFLMDRKDLLDEAGYDIVDFQKELVKKTAFELNILASTVFDKPLRFKYFVSAKDVRTEVMNPEETMKKLYEMYSTSQYGILGEQMMYWMNNDDPMQGQPRAILGGDCVWQGGKTKQKLRKSPKSRK